jgi:putative metalloprotease
MKKHGYNVNAVASAFELLASQSGGASANFLTRMMSSHPDPSERATIAKARAEADGLYKPYKQGTINNKATTTRVTTKKPTKKPAKKK